MQLPASHLFEFKGLARGKKYELVINNQRPIVDRRHESSVTLKVTVDDNTDSSFSTIIVPKRGKNVF